MNSLVNKANRQVTHIKNDLNSLHEALEASASTTPFTSQLSASFSGLQSTIRDLEMMTSSETDPQKRDEYKEKLKLLQMDLTKNRQRFDQLKQQERINNRNELLSSNKTSASTTITSEEVTERLIAQREEEVISNTSNRLDDFISIGMTTISDLRSQRSNLKSSQKRLLDATTSLGISQSLMRIINQRSSQERIIFFLGIFFTFLVILILWRYF